MTNPLEVIFPAVTLCFDKHETKYPLERILLHCRYHGAPCHPGDFEEVYLFSTADLVGKYCYRYNGGRNSSGHEVSLKKSHEFEHYSGLSVLFYRTRIVFYLLSDNYAENTYNEAFSNLRTGNKRQLLIDKVVEEKYPYPYNPCTTQSKIKSLLGADVLRAMPPFANYRQESCLPICMLYTLSARCNCTNSYDKRSTMSVSCSDKSSEKCYKSEARHFDYSRECLAKCPLECEKFYYSVRKEGLNFVDEISKKEQKQIEAKIKEIYNVTIKYSQISGGCIYLDFFFDVLNYMEITQYPKMDVSELLSNVGGTLGLFLGISLLTFIEIFEFSIEIINMIKGKRKQSQTEAYA